MAQVTELKTYAKPGINWGKWFLIGTGALLSALILVCRWFISLFRRSAKA